MSLDMLHHEIDTPLIQKFRRHLRLNTRKSARFMCRFIFNPVVCFQMRQAMGTEINRLFITRSFRKISFSNLLINLILYLRIQHGRNELIPVGWERENKIYFGICDVIKIMVDWFPLGEIDTCFFVGSKGIFLLD